MTTTRTRPLTLTFRTPDDVLAAVPVVLGFEPADSVVMLTFGGGETFHARIDLPPPEEVDGAVDLLLEPAVKHRVRQVLFVVYSADGFASQRLLRKLGRGFGRASIDVVEALRADGSRWYAPGRRGVPAGGVPYTQQTHPFRVQSVVDGQVIHRSREQLAASLAATSGVAAVEEARSRVPAYDATQVATAVRCALPAGSFGDDELAGVLQGIGDLLVRDAAWSAMTRDDAEAHVHLWTNAVQRAPHDLVGGAAAVLALAAWIDGSGALAWCAIDRCLESDAGNTLAGLVGELLTDAVPPSAWQEAGSPSAPEVPD